MADLARYGRNTHPHALVSFGAYPMYQGIVADVRAQLDDATFAAAWAAGRALTLEQAVAKALRAAEASFPTRQAHA